MDIITFSQQARNYLQNCDPTITGQLIDANLLQWQAKRKHRKTSAWLYETLLRHASRGTGKGDALGKWYQPRTEAADTAPTLYLRDYLAPILFNFNPQQVAATYGREPKKVWQALGGKKNLKELLAPDGKAPQKKTIKAWKNFVQTICDAAVFFAGDDQYKAFKSALSDAHGDDVNALLVPVELLHEAIPSLDKGLVYNFIKELGYTDYVKPDASLINLCMRAGLVDLKQVQQRMQKKPKTLPKAPKKDKKINYAKVVCPQKFFTAIVTLCKDKGILPYEFDKLMWLVDSGKFIEPDGRLREFKTSKKDFIAQCLVNEAINAEKLRHGKKPKQPLKKPAA